MRISRRIGFAAVWFGFVGCGLNGTADYVAASNGDTEIEGSVAGALRALPDAKVVSVTSGIPRFVEGNLGQVAYKGPDGLRAALTTLAPVFRLAASDLTLKKVEEDELGASHARFTQTKNGLRVVGGDLVVHVDVGGQIYTVNGSARENGKPASTPSITADEAAEAALKSCAVSTAKTASPSLVYLIGQEDNLMRLAYEVEVSGEDEGVPLRDLVYVDAVDNRVLETHPQIHGARVRKVYNASSTLLRFEGQAPVADPMANKNYDALGVTYDYYKTVHGRDSYDAKGSPLISYIHLGHIDNAFWSGTSMYFYDGSSSANPGFGSAIDVVGHEFTHGVTQFESNLFYSQQSGGMNEAMSDIFGESIEAWQRGGRNDNYVDANTFLVAEEVWSIGVPGDALRYMADPAKDGKGLDDFSKYTNTTNVHYSSGIANLAWALLVKGGKHPRGLHPNITVPALGKAAATKIFYRANANYLVSNSTFRDLKIAAIRAANELYGISAGNAARAAFDAVGVTGAIVAVAVSRSQINVSWPANSESDLAGYKVFRNGVLVAMLRGNVTSFANTGLAPNTTYTYTISAFDIAGNESTQSSPASAKTFP